MEVGPLGRGQDHVAVLVGGDTVLRVALDPDAAAPDDGWIAHPLLPGRPLLQADPATRARLAPALGAVLGRLMAAVAALPPPPGVHLDDTRRPSG